MPSSEYKGRCLLCFISCRQVLSCIAAQFLDKKAICILNILRFSFSLVVDHILPAPLLSQINTALYTLCHRPI